MPVGLKSQRERIAARREAEHDRYAESLEFQRRYTDTVTDQTERLAAPMVNTFDYLLTPNGLVSEYNDLLTDVIEGGHQAAVAAAKVRPEWQFEAVNRGVEVEEHVLIEAFARGEVDAEALAVLAPCPDAVRYDGVDIGAYDRERLKMMVRIVTRLPNAPGVRITSLSLDGSNYDAMGAIASALGHDTGWSNDQPPASVDVLKHRLWITTPVDSHDELINVVREAYDRSLAKQFGGEWYAGRPHMSIQDARTFVEAQKDFLDEHMGILNSIFALTRDPSERNRLMQPHRYELAAALDDRLHGKQVTSLKQAGDTARSEGRDFTGDCAIAIESTDAQLNALGYRGKVYGTCPMCKENVWYDPCAPVCPEGNCPSNGKQPNTPVKTVRIRSIPAQRGSKREVDDKQTPPSPQDQKYMYILGIGGVRRVLKEQYSATTSGS